MSCNHHLVDMVQFCQCNYSNFLPRVHHQKQMWQQHHCLHFPLWILHILITTSSTLFIDEYLILLCWLSLHHVMIQLFILHPWGPSHSVREVSDVCMYQEKKNICMTCSSYVFFWRDYFRLIKHTIIPIYECITSIGNICIYNALCFMKEKNLNLFITLQSPFHLSLKKLSAWDTRNIEKLDFPLNQAYSKLKNLTDENWYTEKEQKDSWPVFPSLQILHLFLLTSVLLKSVLF